MSPKEAQRIIHQRTRPSIFDFCYITTRSHLKAFWRYKKLLQHEQRPLELLDLGCGQKPFQHLLKDVQLTKYVGVDFDSQRSAADVVAPVENVPLPDDSFDTVIASEVFEHTPNLEKAVAELRRLAKSGALAYISTPFMFPEHGTPYDFQRITKYKYFELFKHDEILLMQQTNSSLATPFFLFNVCWENITILKMIPVLTQLVYCWNNLCALIAEALVNIAHGVGLRIFWKKKEWFEKLFRIYFSSMPGGYDVIVRIKK